MLLLIVACVFGYILGVLVRISFLATRGGLGWIGSLLISCATWIVAGLVLAIYADVELGATRQPVWVGQAALWLAAGLFFGIKRKKKLPENAGSQESE